MNEALPPVSRRWEHAAPDPDGVERLATEMGVSRRLAGLLMGRGHSEAAAAQEFLDIGPGALHDHRRMKGIAKAVEAVHGSIARGEKITI